MKTTAALHLGPQRAALADYALVLELSGCGRGFLTAECDRDCTGELVRLDLGIGDTTYRWFTGYVERCGPAGKGYKRLFVREFAGALQMDCPLSLQHPTLRDVCDQLQTLTGLVITTPDQAYSTTQIPHFKSMGTGYLAIERLGSVFSIADYCWYPLPDGTVYAGSYADSRFAGAPVTIPEDFAQCGAAGNALTMGLVPAIRPGVRVNGRRIIRVEARNSDMTLSWAPFNARGKPVFDPPEKRQMDKHYPELAARLHVPRLARVVSAPDSAALGDIADPFRSRFAVNLQLLDENGADDTDTPELAGVPLPVPMAGSEGGMFQYPAEGMVVEVGFADGRPDKPIIRQTLQDGQPLPDIRPGEQLQQQRAGVSQRVTREGSWQRETDQAITETSATRHVTSDAETRETTTRQTTVSADTTTTVIGTVTLMAGQVLHIADGDYSVGASGKYALQCQQMTLSSKGDSDIQTGGALTEKIAGIRKSVAAAQEITGNTVNIGNGEINLLDCLTDTLDVLQELATLTAQHSHSGTGTPTNATALTLNAARPDALKLKYGSVIG